MITPVMGLGFILVALGGLCIVARLHAVSLGAKDTDQLRMLAIGWFTIGALLVIVAASSQLHR